jgi:hypothetical protein
MKKTFTAMSMAAALCGGAAAHAQVPSQGDRICAQGTYSTPCPRVIWCPGAKCGIGVARPDGELEILYSSEKKMDGTRRRPVAGGTPMSLDNLVGRVVVFEWEESGQVANPGADLPIKDILYVIMAPPNTGG